MEQMTERQAREVLAAPPAKREEIVKQIAETGVVPSSREIHEVVEPEPEVTTSTPSAAEGPEAPAPKPEPLDVADFTCNVCNRTFRIVHVADNLHRFVPVKEPEA